MTFPDPRDIRLSRRQASQLIAGATLLGAAGLAAGQQPRTQPKQPNRGSNNNNSNKPDPNAPPAAPAEPKSLLDGVIKPDRTRDWVLKPTIHVQAYQEDPARVPKDGSRTIHLETIKFQSAAMVFPVIHGCASSKTGDLENVVSRVTFDDRPVEVKPDYNDAYHSNVRLGRWEVSNKEGRECELQLEIPMSCWQTVFDEKLAAKAEWPKGGSWGKVGASTLAPQDRVDKPPLHVGDPDDAAALQDLVKQWLNGEPPTSLSPLMLAKTFAGKAMEQFQKSGIGEAYNQLGAFVGLDLQGPAVTIAKRTGSPHDLAAVLLGAYRAAGLPSRLVIGYDESDRKGENSSPFGKNPRGGVSLRSWVEFCLFDPETRKEFWVPVDIVRMRARSSRIGKLDEPWKYFGTHEELDAVLPFAHHYIPPTTVYSYGYAFWAWLTMPTTQIAEHWVRFTAQTAVRRAEPKNPINKSKKPG